MTTSQLPMPTNFQPAPEDKSLLMVVESGGSCCGGSSCAID